MSMPNFCVSTTEHLCRHQKQKPGMDWPACMPPEDVKAKDMPCIMELFKTDKEAREFGDPVWIGYKPADLMPILQSINGS